MKYLFYLFFIINSAVAQPDNLDNIIESIYGKVGDEIMDKIFVDKKHLKDGLVRIDLSFDIDLFNVNRLSVLNSNMQNKLLRKYNQERTDITESVGDIGVMDIFKDARLSKMVISNVAIPVILGNTYKGMDEMIKGVLNITDHKRKANYIVLTGDRPFVPEDFDGDKVQWVYNMLVAKNIAYKDYFNEIKDITTDYLASMESNAMIKRGVFYNKLIFLINQKIGDIGSVLLDDIQRNINTDDKDLAVVTYRGFLYNEAIKYLPNEYDMAVMLLKKYDISNSHIILSKTKYEKQDRATTIDTYYDLLTYIDDKKLNIGDLVFISINNQIYRQWFEFIQMMKDKNKLPRFGYVPISGEIDNTSLLVDEFARLFYDFNKL